MLRILIADGHDVVRQGLRIHVGTQPNWTVVADAADGQEAVHTAIEMKPDVVVLAYKLRRVNTLEAIVQIRSALPKTEVLIYTLHKIEHELSDLIEAGARGCVLKSEPMESLIEGIRSVASQKQYFAGIAAPPERVRRSNGSGMRLTGREATIVRLIVEGRTNKEAARTLGISLKTVESHRTNIMTKLELGSFAALVRYAVRNQIVEA
jgi:DNA-binding NarL/FixJ family response regulator